MKLAARTLWLFSATLLAAPAAAQSYAILDKADTRALNDKARRLMVEMLIKAHNRDCRTVDSLARQIRSMKAAKTFSSDVQAIIDGATGSCAAADGRLSEGYPAILRATAFDANPPLLWTFRLRAEVETGALEDAVATVEAMSVKQPEMLNSGAVSGDLWALRKALAKRGDTGLGLRLLALLTSDAYRPVDVLGETGPFKLAYARLLHDRGENAKAATIVRELRDTRTIVDASLDSRFRALFPEDFDFRAVAEKSLAHFSALAAQHPKRLTGPLFIAEELMHLGRPQEAITLLNRTAEQIGTGDPFSDVIETGSWIYDAKARAHAMQGDYRDSVEAFRTGIRMKERGWPNVSQTLNLAVLQNQFGHHVEALQTLAEFENKAKLAAPYGEMALRHARGCALARSGNMAKAQGDIAFAREHEKDAPGLLTSLLLCVNDMEGAQAVMIRRLADPELRTEALKSLSDFEAMPRSPKGVVAERMERLKALPSVRTAAARAGSTRSFNIVM